MSAPTNANVVEAPPISNGGVSLSQAQDPVLLAISEAKVDKSYSRNELCNDVAEEVKELYKDFLNIAFEYFPHKPKDGSSNCRIFEAIRHRVLRQGNNLVRKLPMIARGYVVVRVKNTEFETYRVPGEGEFDLPPGVKMRTRDSDD